MAPDSQPGGGGGEPIPLHYRIPLLYVEPPLALGGAILLHFAPASFFASISPNDVPSDETLASVRILTDMLAAMHVAFAFTLAFVMLRQQSGSRGEGSDQGGTWRLVCAGMLLSDGLHIAAAVREYGWAASLSPGHWRAADWVNWVVLWGMGVVRLGAVLGVGLGPGQGSSRSNGSAGRQVKG